MAQHNLMPQIALATYDDEAKTVRLVFYQRESNDPLAPVTNQVVVYIPDAVEYTMEEAPSDPAAQQVVDQQLIIEPGPADETVEG